MPIYIKLCIQWYTRVSQNLTIYTRKFHSDQIVCNGHLFYLVYSPISSALYLYFLYLLNMTLHENSHIIPIHVELTAIPVNSGTMPVMSSPLPTTPTNPSPTPPSLFTVPNLPLSPKVTPRLLFCAIISVFGSILYGFYYGTVGLLELRISQDLELSVLQVCDIFILPFIAILYLTYYIHLLQGILQLLHF